MTTMTVRKKAWLTGLIVALVAVLVIVAFVMFLWMPVSVSDAGAVGLPTPEVLPKPAS